MMSENERALGALVSWYKLRQRDLPWRRVPDPYAIFVSELMLQQTQVATVLPYYERFLTRFPDVESLARASEQEVLALWAGLGYYRRARMLHQAAKSIVAEHGGVFPRDFEQILALPGVGRYTAGAVGSFAFGLRVPIVEANSARVLARLFALRVSVKSSPGQRELWRFAEQLLPETGVREHNYALMELGSLVCTPVRPLCGECPLRAICLAYREQAVEQIPLAEPRKQRVRKSFAGAVVEYKGSFLVRRIEAEQWHAGLFEFPKVELEGSESAEQEVRALRELLRAHCTLRGVEKLGELSYSVTHHAVSLHVWSAQAVLGGGRKQAGSLWMSLEEIAKLPLASAQRRILTMLENDRGIGARLL